MKHDKNYIFIITILGDYINSSPISLDKFNNFKSIEIVNKGDKIIRKGTFIKNADSSFVTLIREVNEDENWNKILNEILDKLIFEFEAQISNDANQLRILLHIAIDYENQCNFELTSVEIAKLNKINASFSLSANFITKDF